MKSSISFVYQLSFVRLLCVFVALVVQSQYLFSEGIILHYDSVSLCRGDSFALKSYLDNQVEVPMDYMLLGWRETQDSFIVPRGDTVLHIVYVRKDSPSKRMERQLFIQSRGNPKVEILSPVHYRCVGTPMEAIEIGVQNCDHVYWQDIESGREYGDLADYGLLPGSHDQLSFYLIGSNEECPEVSVAEYNVPLVDPVRFRLGLDLPPDQVSICADSLLLCDYIEPHLVKLYYADELRERFYDHEFLYDLTWETEDSYTLCQDYAKVSYTNKYDVAVSLEEPYCHTLVKAVESHELSLYCVGDSTPDYSVSYTCSSGKGLFYVGAGLPIIDAKFRNLSDINAAELPVYHASSEYDLETYRFPYRGCAVLCWDDRMLREMVYEVSLLCLSENGDTILGKDTLIVSACKKKAPIIQTECISQERKSMVYLASMDSIVGVEITSPEHTIYMDEGSKQSSDQKKYLYTKTYSFSWDSVLYDTITLDVQLSYLGCGGDIALTEESVTLINCASPPTIYYGAFPSPSTILLQRKECLKRQCSNQKDQTPPAVEVKMDCVNDTLYLKLKAKDFEQTGSYDVCFLSQDTFRVVYPTDYTVVGMNHYRFYNKEMNPTFAFVPRNNEDLYGTMNGIAFLYKIELAERVVKNEYELCQGDTLDLNLLVDDEGDNLRWNVTQTAVSPLKDTEYYLYGISTNGCLIDEKVLIKLNYPLWFHAADEVFCEHTYIMKDELLHTNSQQVVWYENQQEIFDDEVYLVKGNQYEVELFSLCDSAVYSFSIRTEDCEEEKDGEEGEGGPSEIGYKLSIPLMFTPDGDGLDDEWCIYGLSEQYGTWCCIIYDRFGKVMKRFDNQLVSWDGHYQGEKQPSTDYWYALWLNGEKVPQIGHFTLLNR